MTPQRFSFLTVCALLINLLGLCHPPGIILLAFPTITWYVGIHYIEQRNK